ncbi:bifunctional helix-turn-helix transcriptional regulator/GNAT family N-acetyltransferase [Oleidesulfovibrio sp.]|uniref:bifunctional helix-turn-helix transcriptional regulator/GNAT family N-acetyltransferase n=1 Tax=Oleidesulfovibrio sp. TaxID=2909707 RepID=UPI003A8AB2D7
MKVTEEDCRCAAKAGCDAPLEVITPRRIRKVSRKLAREWKMLSNCAEPHGLTISEAHALIELEERGPLAVQAMADLLLVDKSNASRALQSLAGQGFVQFEQSSTDGRAKLAVLTDAGHKRVGQLHDHIDAQVTGGLTLLAAHEQQKVLDGLATYARALRYSRLQEGFSLRPATPQDNEAIAEIIRSVSEEYGLTAEAGYAVGDASVDNMYAAYDCNGAQYWVVEHKGRVVGGGGIAPLAGGGGTVGELQKMYFMPECRGRGLGRRLVLGAMEYARSYGYTTCYLETTGVLKEAIALYEKLGFIRLEKPLGSNGHCVCEARYVYPLTDAALHVAPPDASEDLPQQAPVAGTGCCCS